MATANIQAVAVTVLSLANVWLWWWDVRWLMYYQPLGRLIPGVNIHAPLDPILEVPGAIAILITGYALVYRSALPLWRQRFSNYRDYVMVSALTRNVVLLVIVIALGITEWLVLYGFLPVELIVVGSLGMVAALGSIYIQRRPRWPRPLPFSEFEGVEHGP